MTAPAAAHVAPSLKRFGWRGLQTLGLGVVVALFLSLLPGQRFVASLVFSVCIAIACWLLIDSGRMLLARWVHRRAVPEARSARSEWPGWGWRAVVLPLGTLAGYALGHRIAAAVLGSVSSSLLDKGPQVLAVILLLSLIPGVGATYFFWSRAHLAASQARVAEAERLAAEQRLKLLASQLEPHMLFNTLANLRALIGVDPARARRPCSTG